MIKKIFLILLLYNIDSLKSQPGWDGLDFQNIEEQLKTNTIVKLIDMHKYLKANGKIDHFANEVYLAELENGLLAVFKPEKDLNAIENCLGELVAYEIDKILGFKLVPPTVLITYEGRFGSLQFFVESPFDLLKNKEYKEAFSILDDEEINRMYMFCYILGQWDTHHGNKIIAFNQESQKAKLALIDNAGIINFSQSRYGEHAFVQRLYDDSYVSEKINFPFDKAQIIKLPIKYDEFVKRLDGFNVSKRTLKHWNSSYKSLCCVVWNNRLWIQYYKNNESVPINYTDHCSKATYDAFKKLDRALLEQAWSKAYEYQPLEKVNKLIDMILQRRDEVNLTINGSIYKFI